METAPDKYLVALIEPLLKNPDLLVVEATNDDLGLLLSITCHKHDMGVIIGKSGETAKAIRHLARIVGIRQNLKVSVKINEPL